MNEQVPTSSGRAELMGGDQATTLCQVSFLDAHWRLVVPCGDHISGFVRQTGGPYEPLLLGVASALLHPGDVVVDVGANIGNHSVCLARCAGVSVVAVEPNPVALDLLVRNVELNNLQDQVFIVPAAAGAAPGWASVGWPTPGNLGATGLAHGNGPLPVLPLDALFMNPTDVSDHEMFGDVAHGPDGTSHHVSNRTVGHTGSDAFQDVPVTLLKIDVGGDELAVLQGAAGLLNRFHPYVIAETATRASCDAVTSLLDLFGYRRWHYDLAATPTFLWVPESRRLPGPVR